WAPIIPKCSESGSRQGAQLRKSRRDCDDYIQLLKSLSGTRSCSYGSYGQGALNWQPFLSSCSKEQPMSSVTLVAKSKLPTPWGTFTLVGFQEAGTGKHHAALVMGDVTGDEPMLGRIHSECLTGDALFSLRCDCG